MNDVSGDSNFILTPELEALCRRWSVVELSVFGSVANRTAGPLSDVDVLVSFDPAAKVSLWDVASLRRELETLLGRPVDVLTRSSVEAHGNPWMKASIISSATQVYRAA